MLSKWRLIVATSLFFLGMVFLAGDGSWLQNDNTAKADDPLANKKQQCDDAEERKPSLDDVLVSRIDFSLESSGAYEGFGELANAVRESLSNVPAKFEIVLVGPDLQMEGITKNQQIAKFDAKSGTVAELLTTMAIGMNPVRTVRDPSEQDQRVVWTVGPDPKDPDKKSSVVLITTRSTAKRKGYRLPAAFLPEAERMNRLIIRGTPLKVAPAAKPALDALKKPDAGWSKIISQQTLEDEIRKVKLALDKDIAIPVQFARGGYKSARRNFSELAVLFGIIHEYDGMIRWQYEANDAKQRFSRTARMCKVGSIQSLKRVKAASGGPDNAYCRRPTCQEGEGGGRSGLG